jgi:hypothetical protein
MRCSDAQLVDQAGTRSRNLLEFGTDIIGPRLPSFTLLREERDALGRVAVLLAKETDKHHLTDLRAQILECTPADHM